LLTEAAALIAAVPPEMRTLKTVAFWRERIRAAAAGAG
jgi:hypothetical protein